MDSLDAMLENGLWFIRNNPLIMKKLHPDENLLKEDVSTVPVWVKLINSMVYLSSFARVMIELRADVELKDNIVVAMPKITREGHYTFNVRVECSGWSKMGFKPQKKYRPVPKKLNASSSGNKKKGVKPTIEASSSGSFIMNIDNDEEFTSNTLIGEKIDKIERQICEGKLRLLNNDRKPLVPTGIVESDSELK
nr:hypothetical protein [Tanacetum cinerariifolium]GFB15362.1 hypothetical protein [Tanacetum cinerariifolium]